MSGPADVLRKLARTGVTISLRIHHENGSIALVEGRIVEIGGDYLVLQSEGGDWSVVGDQEIVGFNLGAGPAIGPLVTSPTDPKQQAQTGVATSRQDSSAQPERSDIAQRTSAVPPEEALKITKDALSVAAEISEDDFSISGLNVDDSSDLAWALNKYRHSIRSNDPRTCAEPALKLGRLGERLQRGEVYLVAAKLARFSGSSRAAELLAVEAARLGALTGWLIASAASCDQAAIKDAAHYLSAYLGHLDANADASDWQAIAPLLVTIARNLRHRDLEEVIEAVGRGAASELRQTLLAELAGLERLIPHPHPTASPRDASQDEAVPDERAGRAAKPTDAEGSITRTFVPLEYGFIQGAKGESFVFQFRDVADPRLLGHLKRGFVGTRVRFLGSTEIGPTGNRRSIARSVESVDEIVPPKAISPASAPRRKRGGTKQVQRAAPRRIGAADRYRLAKQAEADNDLERARSLFLEELEQRGPMEESALKDLAWLLNRLGEWRGALDLLDKYGSRFEDGRRPIQQLRLNIMLKGTQYEEARTVIAELLRDSEPHQRLSLKKQDIYCLMALGHPQEALQSLDTLIALHPGDPSLKDLREVIERFADRGPATLGPLSDADLQELQTYGLGLSTFAIHALESCELVGLDERSKARGYFLAADFRNVERYLERIRGQRPRERADAALTLAYMCWREPRSAGTRNLNDLLRRYFSLMASAGWHNNANADAIRAYASEALALSGQDRVSQNLPVLMASYLGAPSTGPNQDAESLLKQFEAGDHTQWEALCIDLPYFMVRCPPLGREIDLVLKSSRCKLRLPADLQRSLAQEINRQSIESTRLDHLVELDSLSAARLQEMANDLDLVEEATRFSLDRKQLRELSRIVRDIGRYWLEREYTEKASLHSQCSGALDRLSLSISNSPTHLSIGHLKPVCSRLKQLIEADYATFETEARPSLAIHNVLENDQYHISADGTVLVSLELALGDGSPPIEDLQIVADESGGLTVVERAVAPHVLRAGARIEIRLKVRPSERHIADQVFTLSGQAQYRSRDQVEVTPFSLAVRIDNDTSFQEIPNPYATYSGGTVVDDPNMFFGRKDLLERIQRQVTAGAIGQCFVLYGQKRSGKTSVLAQLRQRLDKDVLPVYLTLGAIDTEQANRSFTRLCIEELRHACEQRAIDTNNWPSDDQIDGSPIEWLRRCLRAVSDSLRKAGGTDGTRIVLLVDEFTYIYEYIVEGLVDSVFMRQWKGLLEGRHFSAVVVGQDSMPAFKQAFPNEFGVTHDERISYLSREEAELLATVPMSHNGKSRFRGRSLEKLLQLTSGSPWFIQIMCDELVCLLNDRKAPYITEADVDAVVRDLISGPHMLPIERFDPLITAAGEAVGRASRETYLDLLAQISAESTGTSGARLEHLFALNGARDALIDDMVERQVLKREPGNRVRLSVGLFEEWLRVNRPTTRAVSAPERSL